MTEPRRKVLEPLVQHIGRRLTLKQAANGTFIIGGGWPARREERSGALLDDLGERRRQRRRRCPRHAGLRDVRVVRMWTGVMAFTADLQPVRRTSSASLPGYFMCIATTGFTLSPLIAQMLAAQHRPRRAAARRVRTRPERSLHESQRRELAAATGPRARRPFREDESYDPDAHRALIDWYSGQGLHGVLINGTTGEWFSQTTDERKLVAETAIEAVGGPDDGRDRLHRLHRARGRRSYARHAVAAGADGVESTAPPYVKPFDDEIVAYYEELAAATDAPLMVYNWVHGTAVDMTAELVLRLAEIDTIVSLKDSTPNQEQFFETASAVVDRLRVFGPYMSTEGYAQLKAARRRRLHRRRHASSARPTRSSGRTTGAGDDEACLAHARRTEELFPRLWLPGGWAGQVRRLPEPAEGDHEDARSARRRAAPPAAAGRRPAESLGEIRAVLVEFGLLQEHAAA